MMVSAQSGRLMRIKRMKSLPQTFLITHIFQYMGSGLPSWDLPASNVFVEDPLNATDSLRLFRWLHIRLELKRYASDEGIPATPWLGNMCWRSTIVLRPGESQIMYWNVVHNTLWVGVEIEAPAWTVRSGDFLNSTPMEYKTLDIQYDTLRS